MNFSAVILAGGKSSRMGRDKAWLEIDGQPLLARQIAVAREAGAAEIFISGRADTDYSAFGCRVLRDHFVGAGPLAGIERALAAAASPLVLVLAVDMPRMNAKMLQRLREAYSGEIGIIPRVNSHTEPLAAFYPKSATPLAESLLRIKNNSVTNFAEFCVQSGLAHYVELSAPETEFFMNWNSPADFDHGTAMTSAPAPSV